jgi:hypothetical protein
MKHMPTLCEQNAEFLDVKASDTYTNHCDVQD